MISAVKYQLFDEGYSVITLNRPEKRNAISKEMVKELKRSIEQARKDSAKFLVITGAGDKMFCAGGDLQDLHGGLTVEQAFQELYAMKEVLFEVASFPMPTICLLNGDALGGGCEIATACDFRIARESNKFGFIQTKLGISPGWGGGALLYEKVHSSFAYQWIMEAAIHSAAFLHECGWIHKIVMDDNWGDQTKLLESYRTKSYDQMKILKKQYTKKLSILSLSALMDEEVRNCANLWDSREHKHAVAKFLSR
ncbi:enoyl-CoA hydratase/isomerase family protein [Virgibacillus oceani]|uniref:Enoyl-CoA hydratase n=1 Tax=Virgibacillus oceani TaxID=1479511 RepID=A0A917H6P4_9BACI|nr:enoyl-CoA hydratase/isomerase family protein [Virgibacillus oceani]GGG69881.1 enoyl-CoA hydratase [Virgibacillus oceani]